MPSYSTRDDRAVGAGFSCAGGEQCCASSYCSTAGVCTCPSGTVQVDAQCITRDANVNGELDTAGAIDHHLSVVPPNSPCNAQSLCQGGTLCLNGVCLCASGFVLDGGQCRASTSFALPGQSCLASVCTGGSLCTNTICACAPGMTVVGQQCLSVGPVITPAPNTVGTFTALLW